MSLLDLLATQEVSPGQSPLQAEPSGFVDNLSANFSATRDNYNSESEFRLQNPKWQKSLESYNQITGFDPLKELEPEINKALQKNLGLSPRDIPQGAETNEDIKKRVISEHFQRLRDEDPERYKGLKTFSEVQAEARAEAQESLRAQQEVYQHAEGSLAKAGSFVGGFAGAMTDPINILSMGFGAGAGRSILKTALVEAGVGTVAESVIQPQVVDWQKQIGNEYGIGDVMQNLVFAAGGGAVLGGGIKGLAVGARNARPKAHAFFAEVGAKIENMDSIPRSAKSAVKYFERVSHIKEMDPVVRANEISGIASRQHEASLNIAATRVFSEQLPIRDIELGMTTKQFNSINTKKIRDLTPEQASRLEDIEKFKNKNSVETVKSNEDISNIDLDGERVQAKKASREAMTDADLEKVNAADFRDVASVEKINKKTGEYTMRVDGQNVKAKVKSLGDIAPGQAVLVRKTKDGYEAYPLIRDTFEARLAERAEAPDTPIKNNPLDEALSVRAEPNNLKGEVEYYKAMQGREFEGAMMADANRMLKEDPDMIIYDAEGNGKTLKEFMKDIEADEKGLTAMKTCTIGG